MNAGEILELVRAGYTRAEIDAMNAPEEQHDDQHEDQHEDQHNEQHEDQHNEQHEDQHDEQHEDPVPAWAQALNNTLDELRKTIQASNIAHDDMGDEEDVIDAGDAAMAQYLTGKAPEAKSKGGRKTK